MIVFFPRNFFRVYSQPREDFWSATNLEQKTTETAKIIFAGPLNKRNDTKMSFLIPCFFRMFGWAKLTSVWKSQIKQKETIPQPKIANLCFLRCLL
jgi:hypothetical protein